MKTQTQKSSPWKKTPHANLYIYVPFETYYARFKVNGKIIKRSLGTHVKSVALVKLSEMQSNERAKVKHVSNLSAGKLTMGDAMTMFKARVEGDMRMKQRTKNFYNERITALVKSWPTIESEEAGKITKLQVEEWGAKFGKAGSASAFNQTVVVLRSLFKIAMEAGVRHDNPALAIRKAKIRIKPMKLPEPAQFVEFIKAIGKSGGRHCAHVADLVQFLAYGGMRISEADRVTWGDIDLENGEIRVLGDPEEGTKNGEFRVIPILPNMRELLISIQEKRGVEPKHVPVMKIRECEKSMTRAAKKVGMERITHHDLRHLFATRCIEAGVDIPTVSRWLGHKDGGVLAMKTYGHLRQAHNKEMAAKVRF